MCEWVDVLLGEVANLQGGYAFSSDLFMDSGVPLTRMNSLKQGRIDHSQSVHVPSGIATKFQSFLLREGDLLLGMSGSLSNYAVVRGADLPALLNQRVMRVSARSELVEQKFLCSVLTDTAYERYAYSVATGNAQLNISSRQISEFEFPLPPLPHQRKIAKILSTVDNLIEKTEALIAKYQSIKQGMMHDLFTRGVDKNGKLRPPYEEAPHLYKESELGWIPKEWEVVCLRDFGRANCPYIQTGPFGSSLKTEHWTESGVPVVTIGALAEGMIDRRELLFVSEQKAEALSQYRLNRGDIVFSRVADVGRSVVVSRDECGWVMSSNLMRIMVDSALIRPTFLNYLLAHSSMIREQVRRSVNAGGREVANASVLNRLRFPKVPPSEQDTVLRYAGQLMMTIASNLKKSEKLQLQKQALMQDLLTGKVQVTPDPEDYGGVA